MKFPVAAVVGLVFCASELAIMAFKRSKAGAVSKDRNSLRILVRVIFISIFLGIWTARAGGWGWWAHRREVAAAGVAVFALGIGLRWWSIILLGRFFTVDVAIAPDHRLVVAGPYRWLRHPSYTGALVAFLGMGMTMGNLASVAVMLGPILGAFLWRIGIEEEALVGAFGDGYLAYRAKTKRLIPFVY